MTILISGFCRSDGEPNASALLVESLQSDLPEPLQACRGQLRFHHFAYGDNEAAAEQAQLKQQLADAREEFSPEVCLFTGQAPGRNRISIERLALNLFRDELIEPDGPVGCWSNLPGLAELPVRLQSAGIPAELSSHAGTYLCNHLLYSALRLAESTDRDLRAGFVHLPINPRQLDRHPGAPFMVLDMVRAATVLIVQHIIRCSGAG